MVSLFQERLRLLRGALSQSDFSQKIGFKQTTYSGWETGGKDPGASALMKISNKLGVSADWLLGLVNDPSSENAITRSSMEVKEMQNKIDALEAEITRLKGENAGLRHAIEVLSNIKK